MRFNSMEQNPSQQTLYGTKRYLKKNLTPSSSRWAIHWHCCSTSGTSLRRTVIYPGKPTGDIQSGTPNQSVRQNPVKQYPSPPFSRQPQERPDHGEKSYQGYGQLVGCKALITGGNSGIGRVAAIAFAREAADVAIKSRLDSVQLL